MQESTFVCDEILRVPPSFMKNRNESEFLIALLEAAQGWTVSVAYLHMCTGLHHQTAFSKLLVFLRTTNLWAINLGELEFTAEQLEELLCAIQNSLITHMFYECDALPLGMKDRFRHAIRHNRRKHNMWQLGHGHDPAIRNCTNMWFDPLNHSRAH